jgi:hypothetical protein
MLNSNDDEEERMDTSVKKMIAENSPEDLLRLKKLMMKWIRQIEKYDLKRPDASTAKRFF